MFGGGGGGLDSRKMQQMMKQMGIDIDELDAEEVIIKTSEETLVFDNPDVQRMDAQGQETYNVVGSPRTEEGDVSTTEDDESDDGIPQEDIETVADRAGVSEAEAEEALEATGGMPLDAIERLSE
ncbi:nascent polypeptide-associated complex protein [Halovenus sp. WSH3]|uniref:Nascent polypeptide-associated complex protein n=1 Tax=Halovenus carboxidivorans TaxID=2692199 RepID=A0A6B0THI1_9EURY|nr:nascent polypeptide-associated complex protein [Halovenus carboxidivorans]MXR52649.1 nascent polypeptide-associated complex protein [Halovenus carboxidivorans]